MKLTLLFFAFACSAALAQSSVLDNNPPSVRWHQVNTPNFKVIYQQGVEDQAQRVANTLEHIRKAESRSLGKAPRKISIILQSQSSISNAFVSITPRRSEFYMMPTQDYNFLGTNEWLTLLAAHEYRHVVQFQNSITGFNKLFYYAFGPATVAAMASISVPQWFWEGDAVATETAFTKSGRGRIPNFNLMFHTNLLEGRTFRYDKQLLRSYKHFIPNHYVLGYNMVSYLREKTNDPEVWGKVVKRTWSVPFLPFRFSNSIHKVAGIRVKALYTEMAAANTKRWEEEEAKRTLTSFEPITKRNNKAYTNYSYPQVLEGGGIIALKSGIGDIDQLVVIKDGREEKIFVPGIVNDAGMLSVANSKVIWNEYEFDPRWRVKTYSVIKAYDVVTKKFWRVSKKSRYASAALSPDGYKIVTIETDDQYRTSINVLDFFSHKVLIQFSNPENYFYSMPRFSADGKNIIALKTTSTGKTVTIFEVATGAGQDVFPITNENIGHPVLQGDYLYFNSPVSGIDNIYAYYLTTKVRHQVTSSKYGAYNPAFSKDGKTLYYNEQTRDGLDIVKTNLEPEKWKHLELTPVVKSFYDFLTEQEGRPNLLDSIPQQTLPSKKYSKIKGIINPFSWGAYFDSNLTSATLGVTSRDILNTTAVSAGYNYDIAERVGSWNTTVSYQGLLPIIDVSASVANRSVNEGDIPIRFIERNPTPPQDTTRNEVEIRNLNFTWKEQSVTAGLRIPLLLTRSKYNSSLTFSNHIGYTKVTEFRNSLSGNARFPPAVVLNDTIVSVYLLRDYVGNNNLIFNRFRVNGFRYLKQSSRDFLPMWGQSINVDWSNTGFGSTLKGNLFAFYTQLFFPGLFKHHSINGYWAYQKTLFTNDFRSNYLFANRVPVPRGLSIFRAEQFYSMSANYALPLWYPDVNLGPLLNVQRVRMNGFVDYAFGSGELSGSNRSYTSAGVEVKFDINIIRFLPQLDLGFRYSIGLNPSATSFEFLLGTINF